MPLDYSRTGGAGVKDQEADCPDLLYVTPGGYAEHWGEIPAHLWVNDVSYVLTDSEFESASEDLIVFVANKFNITVKHLRLWIDWEMSGRKCGAYSKSTGSECQRPTATGKVSPDLFKPDNHCFCRAHKDPANRGEYNPSASPRKVGKSPFRPGYVYLVRAVGTPRYKLGLSESPDFRHSTIERQSPYPLEALAKVYTSSMKDTEGYWHQTFDSTRVHGEWFELTESQISAFLAFAQQQGVA